MLLEVEGCYGVVCVGIQQSSIIGECKRYSGMMCGDFRGVYDVEARRKVTSLGHSYICRELRQER